MTTEPRQEAERIVDKLVEAYRQEVPVVACKQHVRLVDALAAAIKLHGVLDNTPLNGDVPKWLPANARLHMALSALRGDETWHAS